MALTIILQHGIIEHRYHLESSKMATLNNLPTEILSRILSFLPSKTAFDVLLVSQHLSTVIDDWIIWRDIVLRNIESTRLLVSVDNDDWKKFARADALASVTDFSSPASEKVLQRLPSLVALGSR